MTISGSEQLAGRALALAYVHSALAACMAHSVGPDLRAAVAVGNRQIASAWSQVAISAANVATSLLAPDAEGLAGQAAQRDGIGPSSEISAAAEGAIASVWGDWRKHVIEQIVAFLSGSEGAEHFDTINQDVAVLLRFHRRSASWLASFVGDATEYPADETPHLEPVPASVLSGIGCMRDAYTEFVDHLDHDIGPENVSARKLSVLSVSRAIEHRLRRVSNAERTFMSALRTWRRAIHHQAKSAQHEFQIMETQ
jgi:hypothetical protein